jgi:hypothetical protein
MGEIWVRCSAGWRSQDVNADLLTIVPPVLTPFASSAFDMLRYPRVSTADLKIAIPDLSTVDSQILARIDIEGV